MLEIKFDDTIRFTNEEGTWSKQSYRGYRVEENGQLVSPIFKEWCFNKEYFADWLDRWECEWECHLVIEHNFIFVNGKHTHPSGLGHTHFSKLLLTSRENLIFESYTTLHNEEYHGYEHFGVDVHPTNNTCGPALQVEIWGPTVQVAFNDRSTRWLFPHPDGQRAAWKHLCSTTAEDDARRIHEIQQSMV